MTDLKGKTSIITGGSRGIGAGIAEKLASFGANIAVIYNGNIEKAQQVREKVLSFGVRCEIYKCDVSSSEECKLTVKNILSDFGSFEILINNAGITKDNLLVAMDDDEFDSVINTNLKGCFNMIKACGRTFIKKKYGKIVNISSVSGLMGLAGQANYSASKAGIIAITKVTARELGGKNVCCNAIAPGFITTDMTKDLDSGEEFLKSIPKGRLGSPEDVANLAVFLSSEMSDYITGETIRVDGGLAI